MFLYNIINKILYVIYKLNLSLLIIVCKFNFINFSKFIFNFFCFLGTCISTLTSKNLYSIIKIWIMTCSYHNTIVIFFYHCSIHYNRGRRRIIKEFHFKVITSKNYCTPKRKIFRHKSVVITYTNIFLKTFFIGNICHSLTNFFNIFFSKIITYNTSKSTSSKFNFHFIYPLFKIKFIKKYLWDNIT